MGDDEIGQCLAGRRFGELRHQPALVPPVPVAAEPVFGWCHAGLVAPERRIEQREPRQPVGVLLGEPRDNATAPRPPRHVRLRETSGGDPVDDGDEILDRRVGVDRERIGRHVGPGVAANCEGHRAEAARNQRIHQ